MSSSTTSIHMELAALVGESQVLADSAERTLLAANGVVPGLVIVPQTSQQVAAILNFASQHQLTVIPSGFGTKLSLGNPPRHYDIALSLRNLRRVIHYEPADLTIGVEAGMSFGEFQALVGRNNLWLPLDPRGGGKSSIGGIIAANAAGPLRQGYGGPRDMVIGLKIAMTDGNIAKTGGRVVKNVAGYDLGKLLTGSLGTLGVIVEANLKLFPKPPERATFTMPIGTLEMARELRRNLLRSSIDPIRMVLIDDVAVVQDNAQPVHGKAATELWLEIAGSHRVIERCMLELRQLAAAVGTSVARREEPQEAWNQISDLPSWLQPRYRDLAVLKAALPLVATEEFLSRAQQEGVAGNIPVAGFAQVGVGIVHIGILQETVSANLAGWIQRLREAAINLGGSLVVEHCSDGLKEQIDVWGAHGDDLGAMRKMKSVWDPKGVLSPGRFIDGI